MARVVAINLTQPVVPITAPLSLARPAVLHLRNIGATTVWIGDESITPETAKTVGYPLYPGDETDYSTDQQLAATLPFNIASPGSTAPLSKNWGAKIAVEVRPL